MAFKAFSEEWAQAYKDEINKSAVYKQAGQGWEGVVALIVEAEPEKNFPESRGVWMDLWHGEARDIKIVS
ncbi:MAG: Fis family transcriptional regulator, partial [Candidatus Dormibacteria bacterium]